MAVLSESPRVLGYASSVGSYSLQLHSYRILRPQLSAHHYSIKQFSEKLHVHVLQSAVIFKNLDTLRSCFSVQSLCFCIVFLNHVKYLQIHATSATSTLGDWHTQKIHACSEVGCSLRLIRRSRVATTSQTQTHAVHDEYTRCLALAS